MIAFEILREAGVRLPRPVGQAVSIVGALVIGQSAVSAGLIGAPMVIVVAITAVSSFVRPPPDRFRSGHTFYTSHPCWFYGGIWNRNGIIGNIYPYGLLAIFWNTLFVTFGSA